MHPLVMTRHARLSPMCPGLTSIHQCRRRVTRPDEGATLGRGRHLIQKFEIGETAVMCNARFNPDCNGEEVTVCRPYGILPIRQNDGNVARAQGYGVMTREG